MSLKFKVFKDNIEIAAYEDIEDLIKNYSNTNNKTKDIIEYLNKVTGKKFRANTKATQRIINARIKEGYTLEDFKKVIEIKSSQWLNSEMEIYLRPETLFGTKFDSYLNQKGEAINERFRKLSNTNKTKTTRELTDRERREAESLI